MSDHVHHEVQLAPLDDFDMQPASATDFDSIDWSSLNEEEVKWEPWMDDIDWSGYYGPGADAVAPGAGFDEPMAASGAHTSQQLCKSMVATSPSSVRNTTQSHEPTPECGGRNIAPRAHKRSFICDSQGCKSKTFSSRTDLYRHQRAHETKIWYSCAAEDCLRKGKKGFYREDKLMDHMIAAHDNDTLFACPDNHWSRHWLRRKCGGLLFTRDIMAIHALNGYQHSLLARLNEYRDCPLPKCPYRIYLGRKGASLDPLQAHLINKHDAKGRQNLPGRIRERGYDAATGEIICPVCPREARLADHSSFYHHFFAAHFDRPATGIYAFGVDVSVDIPPYTKPLYHEPIRSALKSCTFVPDEVRQSRRTILSLWPNFEGHPVWEDVKCR